MPFDLRVWNCVCSLIFSLLCSFIARVKMIFQRAIDWIKSKLDRPLNLYRDCKFSFFVDKASPDAGDTSPFAIKNEKIDWCCLKMDAKAIIDDSIGPVFVE